LHFCNITIIHGQLPIQQEMPAKPIQASKSTSGTKDAVVRIMKVVISVDKNRIAPVFDVAQDLLCYDPGNNESGSKPEIISFGANSAQSQIFQMAETGCNILICGAISRPLQMLAEYHGIVVYGFLTGTVEQIILAFSSQNPQQLFQFSMPGCRQRMCQRRRRRRGSSPQRNY
jgi:predicted Fe-Mo cluster-binding NifX family protein